MLIEEDNNEAENLAEEIQEENNDDIIWDPAAEADKIIDDMM